MRIAILGASGFIGSILGNTLSSLGHNVTGVVVNPNKQKQKVFNCVSVNDVLNWGEQENSKFDVIVNLAARRSTAASPVSYQDVRRFTLDIPKEFILRFGSEGSLVINSSTYIQNFEGVLGNSVDSYGEAKAELSSFLRTHSTKTNLNVTDLYFFTVFGIGDRPNHLIPMLLRAAKTRDRISLSPGFQLMNLMFVNDVIDNVLSVIHNSELVGFQEFYVWNDAYLTVREIVEKVEKVIRCEIKCDWGSRGYSGHEMLSVWPIPIQQLPNLTVNVTLEEGIGRIWSQMN